MKKIGIVSLALGFLAVGLLPRVVSAQAKEVTIDIPFAFIVEDTPLPVGTYKITRVDQGNHRITADQFLPPPAKLPGHPS